MPVFKSFNRCLQGLPAGSTACANVYRWCSSGSPSPTPELQQTTSPAHPHPQQQQGQSPPAASSGLGIPQPSVSLDLGLNFSTMDFEAVARATQAAMARERGAGQLSQQREQELEEKLERQASASPAARQSVPGPASSPPRPRSQQGTSARQHQSHPPPATMQTGAQSRRPQQRQGAPPQQSSSGAEPTGRVSLIETLKDCVAGGKWTKAFSLFTNAVDMACRQVLLPSAPSPSADGAAARLGSAGATPSESTREAECFSALRKMMAAAPPMESQGPAARAARAAHANNTRGVMRWSGQHYYLLWKCLLETGHVQEVERVWSVMQQIGFVEYQLEQRTVNALMVLLRRTSRSTEHMMSTVVPPPSSLPDVLSRHKEIRRNLLKSLEQAAASRHLTLAGANRRTAEGIRITEALERAEDITEAERSEAAEGGVGVGGDAMEASSASGLEEAVVEVGDFNGLLRRARGSDATERILRMMDKLSIEKEAVTYASLIAALHNPQYVLAGHTAEEVAAHQTGGGPAAARSGGGGDSGAVVAEDGTAAPPPDASLTKAPYEAYKTARVEAGMTWFRACPILHRTADVFNEMLYLLRAKTQWPEFDALLVQFRGNAVVGSTAWPETISETHAGADAEPGARAAILRPSWTTVPNGKTYELLIHRARYVHQWEVMWALYDEMVAGDVRGTGRVYEVLLLEARRHPPLSVTAAQRSGRVDAAPAFLLRLYDELRGGGGDVRSIAGTLSVVNAWSQTRSRSNR
ncbi:kinetoplast polyadenylation/uridylation factor 2 [Novymonas esmeraldas]|uniref:Kinetoplast polyadenylation/uridylation factor 2 n=1 Tax=Novymonas esmeraldas TaxID=1808958 RepID=A0AAW0F012_9TRYP